MALNNLPTALQSVIQQGFLERDFEETLMAKLGFRKFAEKTAFMAGIGESITKTRTGLLAPQTTPMAPAANSDITSGLTVANYSVEQYVLSIAQYALPLQLNIVTARVAIASLFLENAKKLAENAARSVDILAQQALYNAYLGGNTTVRVTLGAAATTISVNDIRGFQNTLNNEGQVVPISATYPVNVTVGADVYSLTGSAADSTNVSTSPGGISGTLTFSAAVSVADGTAGNAVVSAVAPFIQRPYVASSGAMVTTTGGISAANDVNQGRLTMQMLLNAKAQLASNNVPPLASGMYGVRLSPQHAVGLFGDPDFKELYRGQPNSKEFRRGVVAEILGLELEETNIAPVQALSGVGNVQRGIVAGEGALVEGEFTREGYAGATGVEDDLITIVEGIAHITREPLDVLKQVVTQSWSYIGGFAVPTDTTANPTVLPTATNAAFKRAVILESL